MRNAILAALLVPFLLACGDEVVNYSAPVGINQKLRSADVDVGAGNAVLLSKSINTEQGNPYGAFVNAATQTLGRAPSRIVVTYLSLELLGTSTGVANLNEVFTGQVAIGFDLNGFVYPVGTVTNPAGVGVPMAATFDSAGLGPVAYADLVGGGFPVVVSGTATPTFAGGSFTADLKATFGFMAYK
jgi:hypothetical protein